MHLVLIQTSGNQGYIFSTNKLRENVGASELTWRTTRFVLDAVAKAEGPRLSREDAPEIRRAVADESQNQPLENGGAVEIVLATSGKALLLAHNLEIAKRVVSNVTARALKEAPGLEVTGVISDEFDWTKRPLHEMNGQVHDRYETVRSNRPGPDSRFLRLPIVADCKTSGLPASGTRSASTTRAPDEKPVPLSASSLAKWDASGKGYERLRRLLRDSQALALRIDELEEEFRDLGWLGVVHADGNGLGEILLLFQEHAGTHTPADNRDYVDKLRRFSLALEECTEKAFITALEELPRLKSTRRRSKTYPLVPLVLGGDDLTVVCDGAAALRFTVAFLRAFEDETAKANDISTIAGRALPAPRLSACAGVAIVKPHYPFSAAYDLSEELLRSAKEVKTRVTGGAADPRPWPCSALDFHVLHDSSGPSLDRIREGKLRADGGKTRLYAKPYVVTDKGMLSGATGTDWSSRRFWNDLETRVAAIRARGQEKQGLEGREAGRGERDGEKRLSASQMHYLREGLFEGRGEADARLRLIFARYPELREVVADPEKPTLFWSDGAEDFTSFLDALDAAKLMVEEP